MKICFVSSEIAPLAKTGGLADVAGALGKYLKQNGHDIRMVMPLYSSIDTKDIDLYPVDFAQNCMLQMGDQQLSYDVYTTKLPGSETDVYLIHCPQLYNRPTIYTSDADEYLRFGLLNRAAIELCQRMGWAPDILHLNDWQTALVPVYLKTLYAWDLLFRSTKTVFTIHNIAYQGKFHADVINSLGLNKFYHFFDGSDLYGGTLNFLKTGLLHADKLTTVSPTYAKEITTQEYGEGLNDLLLQRAHDLVGILNGVDYDVWNPEKDPYIPQHYSIKNPGKKKVNKKALLKKLGLSYSEKAPVLGMISRLVEQKGIDLLESVLPHILQKYDVRVVILGSGEEKYERFLYYTQLNFKDKMVFYRGYDYPLSHLIEAGSDIYLMPSRFEPCGLNQIYSLKYGTIPVVRKTGGLADTVELYDWETQTGTGFVFEHYTEEGFYWALEYAITTYQNKTAWRKIMKNAMSQDFSWKKQLLKYEQLYSSILES